jgi:histone H2A
MVSFVLLSDPTSFTLLLRNMATPSKKSKRSTKKGASKGAQSKTGLIFPTGRVSSTLRKGKYTKRVSKSAGVYLTAVLEYLTAELLELPGKATKKNRITPRAITLAVRLDADLGNLLKDTTFSGGGILPTTHKSIEKKKKSKKSKK